MDFWRQCWRIATRLTKNDAAWRSDQLAPLGWASATVAGGTGTAIAIAATVVTLATLEDFACFLFSYVYLCE